MNNIKVLFWMLHKISLSQKGEKVDSNPNFCISFKQYSAIYLEINEWNNLFILLLQWYHMYVSIFHSIRMDNEFIF